MTVITTPRFDGNGRIIQGGMPAGTSGLVLTAQGAGVDPSYAAASSLWLKIADIVVASATTSITISGLNGNSDQDYMYVYCLINAIAGSATSFRIRPNNDSTGNYVYSEVYITNSTVYGASGATETGLALGLVDAGTSMFLQGTGFLHAPTGLYRGAIHDNVQYTNNTYLCRANIASYWPNSADNITSLVFVASQANGINAGSTILLFKKV